MKFVGLVSGGKDSIYSISTLIEEGHELVGLIHMRSSSEYSDSYMFQTVGEEFIEFVGACLEVPVTVCTTDCKAIHTELAYEPTEGDEVEDLYNCLRALLATTDYQAVSSGAILSRYQKNRVDKVCMRLGIESLAPLWDSRDQRTLLLTMINSGMDARVVKVASPMLGRECVGMKLHEILEYMDKAMECADKYTEMNYCGEGGEYETIVFDCKHFKRRISAEHFEVHPHPEEVGKDGCVYFAKYSDIQVLHK